MPNEIQQQTKKQITNNNKFQTTKKQMKNVQNTHLIFWKN